MIMSHEFDSNPEHTSKPFSQVFSELCLV